ncbi:MAG: hypothetical protein QXY45_00070 [Candidatus Aenigmatarchaeota archaeon]
MEIKFKKDTIELEKKVNIIDKFVMGISKILDKHFKYVIVSGYLPILFGKVRGTEDVDVLVKKVGPQKFKKFYEEIYKKNYQVINSHSVEDAYDMLSKKIALRISDKKHIVPNVELKFISDKIEMTTLKERLKVILNGNIFYISSIEMNIAFKIYLGSRKDIDDACHLYILFKKLKRLDEKRLKEFCNLLGVEPKILEGCLNE